MRLIYGLIISITFAAPDCQEAFPTLEDDFYEVIADLEQDPVVLALPDTSRFPDGRLVVYDRSVLPVFPLVVRESKRRNRAVFRALAEGSLGSRAHCGGE